MGHTGNRTSATLGLIILVFLLGACGGRQEATLYERAQSIDKSLMCPVCAGQTIDQSASLLARQMKAIVREKLADGWTRDQTFQFFVDRYGEEVLAAPPKSGFNLVVWVVPFAAVVAAAGAVILVIRAMRRSAVTIQEDGPPAEAGLEPYLSLVDHELGIAQDSREGREPEGDSKAGAGNPSPVSEDV